MARNPENPDFCLFFHGFRAREASQRLPRACGIRTVSISDQTEPYGPDSAQFWILVPNQYHIRYQSVTFSWKKQKTEWVRPIQEDSQRNSVQNPGPNAPRSFMATHLVKILIFCGLVPLLGIWPETQKTRKTRIFCICSGF